MDRSMSTTKPPLGIFVLWHPYYADGEKYANIFFSEFKRNVKDPLSRGIGIPVFFRCVEPLLDINLEEYKHTVIIVLSECNMVNDTTYEKYINGLLRLATQNTLILPVAIDNTAYNLSEKLSKRNFIRFYENEHRLEYLLSAVTHEIARALYAPKPLKKKPGGKIPPPPLKLFISHAKADGLEVARKIKSYIEAQYAFKTFFDANDITFGYDFPQEIERHIKTAVIIAIHTDKYASREWCRREVLLAKQHNRPILILSYLQDGESRSFPYMANVRTVHYQPMDDQVWPRLIASVLLETLGTKYQELWARHVIVKNKLRINIEAVSAYPPELVTVLTRKKELKQHFVYPDPPIGTEELTILNLLDSRMQYTTPSLLQHGKRKLRQRPTTIGISISECEHMLKMGVSHAHLQDTLIEVARHLLNHGFNLAYGGDPNYRADFNFTELLLQLVQTYQSAANAGRIFIYSAFPLYTKISALKEAELKRFATIVRITPPKYKGWEKIKFDSATGKEKEELDTLFANQDTDSRKLWCESLTLMRQQMTKTIHARIAMGGKLDGFKGKYPGILEEVAIDLTAGHRVYAIESMGGCAKMISDVLNPKTGRSFINNLHNAQQAAYSSLLAVLKSNQMRVHFYTHNQLDQLIGDLIH